MSVLQAAEDKAEKARRRQAAIAAAAGAAATGNAATVTPAMEATPAGPGGEVSRSMRRRQGAL
jgi:hypothetical protein